MTPLRIAHVVEATTGGVARHILDLLDHLDPAEFPCVVYASFERPESWPEPFRRRAERGLLLREMPMARVTRPGAAAQLARWARRDAIDVLHAHSAKAGFLGRAAALRAGIPAIYTPHAFPFQRTTDWRRPLYRMVERRLARHTARILCVSEGERESALAAGLPPEKLAVIPNGLDPAQWPLPTPAQRRQARETLGITDEHLVLGALARLAPQKGIDLLLQAAEELLPDFPHLRLLIWGDGPERETLQRMARWLRLRHVSFLGETRDPWHAFAAMDIFCAPSRWEAGPYAMLEAMACGLPVAASRIPAHADYLVEEETGLLLTVDLPGQFAAGLQQLVINAHLREAYGQAGRLRVEEAFTVQRMTEAVADVYRETAATR